jgi:hypothetical protein
VRNSEASIPTSDIPPVTRTTGSKGLVSWKHMEVIGLWALIFDISLENSIGFFSPPILNEQNHPTMAEYFVRIISKEVFSTCFYLNYDLCEKVT